MNVFAENVVRVMNEFNFTMDQAYAYVSENILVPVHYFEQTVWNTQ